MSTLNLMNYFYIIQVINITTAQIDYLMQAYSVINGFSTSLIPRGNEEKGLANINKRDTARAGLGGKRKVLDIMRGGGEVQKGRWIRSWVDKKKNPPLSSGSLESG